MGLKSGSRDAGLDDEGDGDPAGRPVEKSGDGVDEVADTTDDSPERTGRSDAPAAQSSSEAPREAATDGAERGSPADDSGATANRPTMGSIPYKLRREKVNEGREQVPYFLREEVIDAETELQDTLEGLLGEQVYKSDYREASMIVAQRRPELVAEVLREWGYDLDER